MASIYGLYDGCGELRYIGKANDPAKRLKTHMRERRRRTPLYDWLAKHGTPVMRVLEGNCVDWREAERRLISEARQRGDKLLNVADGGDEPHCPRDVRARNGAKVAAALNADPVRKRLAWLKRELSKAVREGVVSNSTRVKMRDIGKKRPDLFGEWLNLPDRVEV